MLPTSSPRAAALSGAPGSVHQLIGFRACATAERTPLIRWRRSHVPSGEKSSHYWSGLESSSSKYDQAIRSHDPWTSMTPWHTLPRTKQHRRTSLPVPELCTLITGPQLQAWIFPSSRLLSFTKTAYLSIGSSILLASGPQRTTQSAPATGKAPRHSTQSGHQLQRLIPPPALGP